MTSKKLATKVPNINYIGHPQYGYANVQKFEESPEHIILTCDELHLSDRGCGKMCLDIPGGFAAISNPIPTGTATPATPPLTGK